MQARGRAADKLCTPARGTRRRAAAELGSYAAWAPSSDLWVELELLRRKSFFDSRRPAVAVPINKGRGALSVKLAA